MELPITNCAFLQGGPASIYEAAALMLAHKIGGLPVVDHAKLVAIISESDVLRIASQALSMETA